MVNSQYQKRQQQQARAWKPGRALLQNEDSTPYLTGNMQQIIIAAAVTFAVVMICHGALWLFWRLVLKHTTPSVLRVPCVEVMLLGILLVALSFYATISFGKDFHPKFFGGVSVHLALCLPCFIILTWLSWKAVCIHPNSVLACNPSGEVRLRSFKSTVFIFFTQHTTRLNRPMCVGAVLTVRDLQIQMQDLTGLSSTGPFCQIAGRDITLLLAGRRSSPSPRPTTLLLEDPWSCRAATRVLA